MRAAEAGAASGPSGRSPETQEIDMTDVRQTGPPDRLDDPTRIGAPIAGEEQPPNTARARAAAAAQRGGGETRGQRIRRKAHRARLNGYAVVTVALVAVLIALGASNTSAVKVHWLVGTAHVSLVWLVLVAAVLGWVLGLLASARFRWRTRAP
jgi:uncharacterized integral membrane protein